MKKISDALAKLAGVNVDSVKNEPDEVHHVDESIEPEFPTQEKREEQVPALDELDALVAELEREVRKR